MNNVIFRIIISLMVLVFPSQIKSQWVFSKQGNVFDGESYIASVIGYSKDAVYPRPQLNIRYSLKNEKVEVFITDAGSSICDNKTVYISIDKGDVVDYLATPSIGNESWFMHVQSSKIINFIEELQYGRSLEVRLRSNCSLKDLYFNLKGAEKALRPIKSAFEPVYLEMKAQELELKMKAEEQAKQKELEREERYRIQILKDSIKDVLESKSSQTKSIYYKTNRVTKLLSRPENHYQYDIMRVDSNYLLQLIQHKNSFYKVISVCSADSCLEITGYVLILWIKTEDFIISSNELNSLDKLPRFSDFHVIKKNQNGDDARFKVRDYDDEYYLIVTTDSSIENDNRRRRNKKPVQPTLISKNYFLVDFPFGLD